MRATAAPGETAGTTLTQCRVCSSAWQQNLQITMPRRTRARCKQEFQEHCAALVLALHTVILLQTQQGNSNKQLVINMWQYLIPILALHAAGLQYASIACMPMNC